MAKLSNKIVVIDPGHGGHDPGGTGNNMKEKDVVLKKALILGPILESYGITVIYTRTTDIYVSLAGRAKIANDANADLFVSIHTNAGGGVTANGVEVFSFPGSSAGMKLSKDILDSILADNIFKINRGNKTANFAVLRRTKMPAALTETGFIDHKGDAQILRTKKKEIAESIAKGMLKNLGIEYNKDATTEDETDGFTDIKLNYKGKNKSVKGIFKDDTNYIPVRFLEELGYKVSWNNDTGTAIVEDELKKTRKSEYLKVGDAHIIKTTPDNIYIGVLGDTLHGAKVNGINGTFFDLATAPVSSPNSCVFIAINDGKPISNNAQFNGWNGPPRATMIYHKDKSLGFRQLKNINTIKDNTIWAIGGYMVKPYMDFKNERIPGSINYKTSHTYIGYDDKGYIYLIVKPNHMIYEIVPLLNDLGIINCIVLDGGGSSQLRYGDNKVRSNRKINTAVLLKEV